MKNRIFKILIISIFMILFYLFINHSFFECIFLKYLGIACPGCGLTRAFRYIVKLDFVNAFKMNILSIPLFILMIVLFVMIIIDIIKDKFYTERFLMYLWTKYKYLILILLIITMIVNNLNPLIMTSNSLFLLHYFFFFFIIFL